VKQKKKSSNKWNCAVCNEKQSVRKVFAQGYKAKDIRTFVQSFNMSRKSLDDDQQWLQAGTLNPAQEHADREFEFPNELNNNKCTDWTVYLDDDDHHATEKAEQELQGYLFLFLISIIYHKCY
jgi:soluble cytochrome b562